MGSACSKSDATSSHPEESSPNAAAGTIGVMFDRFDKDRKGHISLRDLQDMMKDDKTHIQGRDAAHIMNKYGVDGKMSLEEFKIWWNSTYTTYNDSDIENMVNEINETEPMDSIDETGIDGRVLKNVTSKRS